MNDLIVLVLVVAAVLGLTALAIKYLPPVGMPRPSPRPPVRQPEKLVVKIEADTVEFDAGVARCLAGLDALAKKHAELVAAGVLSAPPEPGKHSGDCCCPGCLGFVS